MKKILTTVFLLALGFSLFAAPFSLNKGGKKVIASVSIGKKTENITQEDLDAKIAEYKAAGATNTDEEILEILVNDKVFLMSAERDKVSVSDVEVDERLRSLKQQFETQYGQNISDEDFMKYMQESLTNGKSLDDYKSALKNSILVDKYLRTKKAVDLETVSVITDDEIKKFYRKNQSQFVNPEYVKISHIFIPSTEKDAKETLQKVLSDIKSGKISFEKAVVEYSQDQNSQKNGGDIGNITASNSDILGEEFIDCIFDLDVGQIADEVIQSPSGYHILKCLFHSDMKFLSIDDYVSPDSNMTVREYIRKYLQQQKAQESYVKATNDFVEELKKSAKIIYTDKS